MWKLIDDFPQDGNPYIVGGYQDGTWFMAVYSNERGIWTNECGDSAEQCGEDQWGDGRMVFSHWWTLGPGTPPSNVLIDHEAKLIDSKA